jgi:hypothetical protein
MRYGVEVEIGDRRVTGVLKVTVLVEAEDSRTAMAVAEEFVRSGPAEAVSVWDESGAGR